MKKYILIFTSAVILSLFNSCSKDGDTIINNYGTPADPAPNRTMLKGYGATDSSQTLRFTYYNNELGKLKELIAFDSGNAIQKFVILYDGSGKPEGFQLYELPANTLQQQGNIKLDNKGRISQILKREINGDTVGISYFQYQETDYQPTTFSYYDHSNKRFSKYEYYNYDAKGNISSVTSYTDNGSDPLYKNSEIFASGYAKYVNPLNQLYYYIVTLGGSYGFGFSSPLYFSNYLPSSIREQAFNTGGQPSSVTINNIDLGIDSDNRPNRLSIQGGSNLVIYFRY